MDVVGRTHDELDLPSPSWLNAKCHGWHHFIYYTVIFAVREILNKVYVQTNVNDSL